jgi:hypothetical protein
MLLVVIWVVLTYRAPGRFRPLWESSSTEQVKQYDELRVMVTKGKDDVYRRRPGTSEYRLNGLPSGKPLPSTPPAIVVIEEGQRYTFEPERDEKGNFKRRKGGGGDEPLRYTDEKGRVMVEGSLGQLESFRGGVFFGNVLLNLAFVASAFVGLWLVLRFQWLHALGQAIVLCLLLMLFVMPQLLTRAEALTRSRATPSGAEEQPTTRLQAPGKPPLAS